MSKSGKIGIITFQRTTNFGSYLQTIGLYKKIKDMGYDAEIIDYRCPAIEKREDLSKKIEGFNLKKLANKILLQPAKTRKAKSLQAFSDGFLSFGEVYFPDTIKKAEDRYDKIIVGSDLVWGRDITNFDYTYFLDFVSDNRKKFAFASSVGDYGINEDNLKVAELLKGFSKIAVREEDAVDWVKEISGVDAEFVCDPTMLLTVREWEELIPEKKQKGRYVLVYFDNDKHKCVNDAIEYARKNNCKVLYINYGLPRKNVTNVKPKSLEEFLGLIKNAQKIFTASYHGILFSVYLHKEFVFYTRAHKSRVLSLANRLDLLDYCGDEKSPFQMEPIDYQSVDRKVTLFREKSIQVLQEMLEQEV